MIVQIALKSCKKMPFFKKNKNKNKIKSCKKTSFNCRKLSLATP